MGENHEENTRDQRLFIITDPLTNKHDIQYGGGIKRQY